MRRPCVRSIAVLCLVTLATLASAEACYCGFQYVSPVPGAQLVSRETNIIVRPGGLLASTAPEISHLFQVQGAVSGTHAGDVVISDDQETVVFKPYEPFAPGEHVSVNVEAGLTTQDGGEPGALVFDFTISPKTVPLLGESLFADEVPNGAAKPSALSDAEQFDYRLPADLSPLTVTYSDSPDPGYLFLASHSLLDPSVVSYIIIADNTGFPVFFRKMPHRARDLRIQPNGLVTWNVERSGPVPGVFDAIFYAMDASYTVVDSFRCGDGYPTTVYDLHILPNGHAVLMSHDPQPVDMSQIVDGGDPAATVVGLVVQELDLAKNVVFLWRSWDHFEITDATHEDLTAALVRYVQGNALDVDLDGNFLISCRNMDEVTKISRESGEIIWRLGGKNNQFTFVNDPRGFSHQHAIRRIANGNITLYDNGNFHSPQYSRAVEYQLDEDNKTATLVWEYRNTPDIYGSFLGYVQRLPSGNTLICWGGTNPTLTEVRPDGTRTLEMTFPYEIYTYRAYRFDWIGQAAVPDVWVLRQVGRVELGFAQFGATDVVKYYVYQGEAPGAVTKVDSTTDHSIFIDGLVSERTYYFRVTSLNTQGVESPFSEELAVVPHGTTAVEEAEGLLPEKFVLLPNYPNPFNASTLIKYSLPRSQKATLAVYDALGQQVALLADGWQDAGFHQALFRGPGLASGTYFYRLEAPQSVAVRKLVLLK